ARSRAAAAGALAATILLSGCAGHHDGDDGAVVVSGNIEVIDAQLAFKIPGRLVERKVDEGDRVTAGQLIARLDDADLVPQLELRRAELAAAEAALAELEAGSRPQEIAAAEAVLGSAEAERHRAALEARRLEELHATHAASDRELESAVAFLRVAEARVRE